MVKKITVTNFLRSKQFINSCYKQIFYILCLCVICFLDFWQLQSCNEFVEEFANEVRRFLQIKCNLIWNCIRGNCWECSWWHSNEGTNVRSLNLNLPLARKVESTLSGARPQTFKPHLESQFALWPGKKGKNQIHLITQNPRTRYTRKQNKQSETTRISYIPVRI